MARFTDFDLIGSLQKTLTEAGLTTPTEIQAKAIPALLEGRSLVGVAETGSGKTLAYALPILHLLKTLEKSGDKVTHSSTPRALILVPTRELGEQVSKVFKLFTHTTRLRIRTVLGGTKMVSARENIKGEFEALVATPGRLLQMYTKRQIDLSEVGFLVFDEADQMLDTTFFADAQRIVAACPPERQIALFSATVSEAVQSIMTKLFADAEIIRTEGSNRVVASLRTENKTVIDGKRFPILEPMLGRDVVGGTLVFTNTREQCDKLAAEFTRKGVKHVICRGEMDRLERRKNLKSFRDGAVKWLISTDLASRGLDVDHVGRVINYHMPQHLENYLHRVGRTARAGRSGLVINFVTERDQRIMDEVRKISK